MNLFSINETNTLKNHKEKVGDIMTSLKSINRRVGSLFAVAALVLATITPGLVPAFASAAQVTERSIELSSSSKASKAVSYKISFKSVGAAKAVVLDFCNDTPLIGATCTAPGAFKVSAATVTGGLSKVDGATANDDNTVVLSGDIAQNSGVVVNLAGVDNPANAGPLYVRIVTYGGADTTEAETAAGAYTSTNLGSGEVDRGSAAASITDTVGVSAAVLESMTFCVSSEVIDGASCTDNDNPGDPLEAPTLKLGEVVTGDVRALSSSAVSTGDLYSQISTNAANGAVVNLKSATACGGLKRVEATGCDIVAANGTGGIANGQARFGVRVATADDPVTANVSKDGVYQIAQNGGSPYYSDSVFKLNFVSGNATGTSSPYGDPLLDTAGAPVNNKNVKITFGASAANNTPAGTYSTDLSLIATGKF